VAAAPGAERGATGRISREHTVLVSASGLVTVTGGKWTTCRAMAEDVLACCERAHLLPARAAGATRTLALVGAGHASISTNLTDEPGLHLYGDEAPWVERLPGAHNVLAPGLSEAMVRFAARHEYALTVGDVLARRSRLLFLDAALAERAAARVAALLQEETGIDPQLETFLGLARQYLDVP
jgi:glycerol-3-phosphate dehydrogenase